ncbi:SIP domain-containing protein [Microbacterium sp. Marseille-Q6965]|uniref:SIP domain-containing protein n=1 Tax=Microbacterium sp. Marseille-Q6965 TaxID=2965072 RepID=UPI0021B7B832|nr:SIP domain-containing protein [Microbacterium sp. Marseille-Q6965]
MSRHTPEGSVREHSDAACRAPRHSRVQHLITADESSLAELETLLATLPICSTGRVFVEVPDVTWVCDLRVPARMTLTWLDRSVRTGAPGTGRPCPTGRALARAVTAWADEMMCGEDDATRVHLLGGYLGTADIVDHLTERRGVPFESIHVPERYRLLVGD